MKRWMTLVIAVIVIVASVGSVLAVDRFYFSDKPEKKDVPTVEEGDTVTVNYIGWLNDDRIYDEKRIFDTTSEEPPGKTIVTYSDRERGEPFTFKAGGNVIEGWNEEIIGMEKGETKLFTVPTEKAYPSHSQDLIFDVNKIETIPVYEEMDVQEFQRTYFKNPKPNLQVRDRFWNWNQTVISIEGSIVTLQNQPEFGKEYRAYKQDGPGWTSKVVSIDSTANGGEGEIKIEHFVEQRTIVNGNHLAQHDDRFTNISGTKNQIGQSPSSVGIVVDTGETITIDFNGEVYGKPLTFKMTVLEIQKEE